MARFLVSTGNYHKAATPAPNPDGRRLPLIEAHRQFGMGSQAQIGTRVSAECSLRWLEQLTLGRTARRVIHSQVLRFVLPHPHQPKRMLYF